MPKTILKLVLGAVLLIAAACAPAAPGAPDPNSINTIVAQTLSAASTQTFEAGIPVTGDRTATTTATVSPEPPAATPSATMTALLLFTPTPIVTSTSTLAVSPGVAQVSVSVPTNCRTGPGTAYPRVGALLVGEVAEVVGRHATRDYWIIRNPDRSGEVCWLWGEYATLSGNPGALPEFTPPPSPTPSPTATRAPGFDIAYNGLESCAGTGWWVDVELENNGGFPFSSIAMTVRDTTNNTVLSLYADDFTDRDGCNETDTRDNLPAAGELLVSSPVFTADPTGHEIRVTVTLCSNPGQSGMCVTESINFRP